MGPLNHVLVARVCEMHGVTPEHLRATIKKRKLYRRALKDRARKRRKWVEANPRAKRRHDVTFRNKVDGPQLYAGEGELHGLLKVVGMTEADFCNVVGIDRAVFYRWYGHPLHAWPVEFLRYFARAQAMGRYLDAQGVDLQQFEPKLPPRMPAPDYPRGTPKYPSQAIPAPVDREWSPWLKPRE